METKRKFRTKSDVIQAYADKRKGLEYEDVEDLMEALIGFLNMKLSTESIDYSYFIPNIGYFHERMFDITGLVADVDSHKLKKTEKMMHQYILKNRIKMQHDHIYIKDDRQYRT
jgi:CRISPR/Cas system type I-B associated protein Csh2 (Cas7 group RAMP superfamily)